MPSRGNGHRASNGRTRFAVVGLGYIAQAAVLPAFAHARRNARLTALVSDDPEKLRKLSRKYDAPHCFSYEEYDACLNSGEVDAVYIALPNSMHHEFTIRAAQAGIHVLCEKPLAVTEQDCQEMIDAARRHGVRLMTAYRLHFEKANLRAVEIAQSGRLGTLRLFHSLFTMPVQEDNIRLQRELGGGTLFDIGIYCINAARYLFRDEPTEVFAFSASGADERFREVDEMTCATMRFPGDRLAGFTSSFGGASVSQYQIVGTEGDLRVDPAYEFAGALEHHLTIRGKSSHRTFAKRDQFAPLLVHFSQCIQEGREPEPSGEEGLADVRIITALYESARTGQPVRLAPFSRVRRPEPAQELHRSAVRAPSLIHAESPASDE